MLKLWLDDERAAPEGWRHTRSAREAIEILGSEPVAELSLDHDLEPSHYAGVLNSRTGLAVALWLRYEVETNPRFVMPKTQVHSQNQSGASNIRQVLREIDALLAKRKTERA